MPSRRHNLQSGPVYRAILRDSTRAVISPESHLPVTRSVPAGTYRILLSSFPRLAVSSAVGSHYVELELHR